MFFRRIGVESDSVIRSPPGLPDYPVLEIHIACTVWFLFSHSLCLKMIHYRTKDTTDRFYQLMVVWVQQRTDCCLEPGLSYEYDPSVLHQRPMQVQRVCPSLELT